MKKIGLVILLVICSINVYADQFKIYVINDTPYTCELMDAVPIKGPDPYPIRPTTLPSNYAISFSLWTSKSLHYVLKYRCGSPEKGYKKIAIATKQNFTALWPGRVSGEVVSNETDPGITAIIQDSHRNAVLYIVTGLFNFFTVGHTDPYHGDIIWSIRLH